jgi:hypothetical protein
MALPEQAFWLAMGGDILETVMTTISPFSREAMYNYHHPDRQLLDRKLTYIKCTVPQI